MSLPEALDAFFSAHILIGVPELSRLLPMDRGTICAHIDAGRLPDRRKGTGIKKPRRVFTRQDVEGLVEAMGNAGCQSTVKNVRHITTLTSPSKVTAFPVRPAARANVTRVKSKTRKKQKPEISSPAGAQPPAAH